MIMMMIVVVEVVVVPSKVLNKSILQALPGLVVDRCHMETLYQVLGT
jgi:hypothetical protein